MNLSGLQKNSPLIRYGLFLIVVILWYSFVWSPLADRIKEADQVLETNKTRIGQMQKQLSKYKGVNSRLDKAGKKLALARKRLVPGKTPQMVASNLQNLLLKKAAASGVEVVTYKTSRVGKWRNYKLAVASLTIKADTENLVNFLKSLKDSNKILRLKSLNVIKVKGRKSHLRVNLEAEALVI